MLDEIGLKYGTDKASNGHDYLKIYERIMPSVRPVNLLEIGWFDGASMRMWREYLHPESEIIGVDIEMKKPIEGVHFFHGNATSYALHRYLKDFGPGPFDYIIDDGSHMSPEVIATLENLWDHVRPGGYYIVEDLQVSYHPDWLGNPDPAKPGPRGATSMQVLKALADDVHFGHVGAGPSMTTLGQDVASIAFYPGLCVIQKMV